MLVQCVTSAFLGATGDFIAQKFVEKRNWKNYDLIRTGRFAVLTGCYIGPILVGWFRILEHVRGAAKIVPLKRLLIDQGLFTPCFLATILTVLRMLEGNSFSQAVEIVKKDYYPIFKFNISFWPPIQLINFYFMPLNFRVIVMMLGNLVWNTCISYKVQKMTLKAAAAAAAAEAKAE